MTIKNWKAANFFLAGKMGIHVRENVCGHLLYLAVDLPKDSSWCPTRSYECYGRLLSWATSRGGLRVDVTPDYVVVVRQKGPDCKGVKRLYEQGEFFQMEAVAEAIAVALGYTES